MYNYLIECDRFVYSNLNNFNNIKGQPCDVLPNPTNGLVTITRLGSPGILPGSQAVYTCNGGYEINGNSIRDCQSDGTWSGSEPTCTPGAITAGE